MKKLLALMMSALLAVGLLAACGDSSSSAPSSEPEAVSNSEAAVVSSSAVSSEATDDTYGTTLEDIQAKGELIIGLDDTFAPMGFRETDGTLVGFDIDLAEAVCAELGVTAVFQPIDWNAKEMELNTGKIDCIWNGMSATPERQESMALSQNYLNNKIIVMTKEGVTIESKDDLVNYNVGTQAASAALEAIQADDIYASIEGNLTEYPTYDEAILDMQAGRIDCIVIDEVFGNYKNEQMGGVMGIAPIDFGDDLYAVGFRKDDTALRDALNDALNAVIDNGTAAEISDKWFGTDIVIRP